MSSTVGGSKGPLPTQSEILLHEVRATRLMVEKAIAANEAAWARSAAAQAETSAQLETLGRRVLSLEKLLEEIIDVMRAASARP